MMRSCKITFGERRSLNHVPHEHSQHVRTAALRGTQERLKSEIQVELEKTSWNSRKLFASVHIKAPVGTVWSCLTDYEGLGEFIPSLVENQCLERRPNGALVRQRGAVQMGVQFSATCTLECCEFYEGLPDGFCSTSGDGSDGLLPFPKSSIPDAPKRDITFVLVEGDFQAFRGVWRLQPGGETSISQEEDHPTSSTLLSYSLFVQPQSWLPVRLVQSRIQQEIVSNLQAIRSHSEGLHQRAVGEGCHDRAQLRHHALS